MAEAIIGGWQLQGVYTYQAGFPIAFGTDGFYNGTDPVNGSDIALDDKSTSKWINTDVFTSILSGTSTLATPVDHLRSLLLRFPDVRRDAINNFDLSLLKSVKLPRDDAARGEVRVHQRLQRTVLPGPGHGHDQRRRSGR